jgi:hypothetical protein
MFRYLRVEILVGEEACEEPGNEPTLPEHCWCPLLLRWPRVLECPINVIVIER